MRLAREAVFFNLVTASRDSLYSEEGERICRLLLSTI